MNYLLFRYAQDIVRRTQEAIEEGLPAYALLYILKDIIALVLPPIAEQAVREEAPTSAPNEEGGWMKPPADEQEGR